MKNKIQIPEWEGTKHTVIGDRIVFVRVEQDSMRENPCHDDGMGQIRSLSRKHIDNIDCEYAVELLKNDPDVVALSYFEHGQSLWMVQGSPAPAGVEFQWDGREFAGVWIPDDCVRESYTGQGGLSRREWMVKQAKSCCDVYTKWANGDCWGYDIQVFKIRKDDDGEVYDVLDDYRRNKAVDEDSCFGFIGHDHLVEELEAAVANMTKE